MEPRDAVFEIPFVCQVLGVSRDQVEQMCRAFGIVPGRQNGETFLERESVKRMYAFLYPPYKPPDS